VGGGAFIGFGESSLRRLVPVVLVAHVRVFGLFFFASFIFPTIIIVRSQRKLIGSARCITLSIHWQT
jgi:hypothetical protein